MRRVVWLPLVCFLLATPTRGADDAPRPLVAGVKDLRAVAAGPGGKVYVAAGGEVLVVQDGKAVPFAGGLGEPGGMATFAEALFVADRDRVWRIDRTGKARVFAAAGAFPS